MKFSNVVFDAEDPPKIAAFWAAATGREVAPDANPYFAFVAANDDFPKIHFMKVPEGKTLKNRMHMDVASPDRAADVARLIGLGATEVGTHNEYGTEWTTLRDPEGNEFCVVSQPA